MRKIAVQINPTSIFKIMKILLGEGHNEGLIFTDCQYFEPGASTPHIEKNSL